MTQTAANPEPAVLRSADEWREIPAGTRRVAVGAFVDANHDAILIELEGGQRISISIQPRLMFQMDMVLNPRFEAGARRAIRVEATGDGWRTTPADMLSDVDGHGAAKSAFAPETPIGPSLATSEPPVDEEILVRIRRSDLVRLDRMVTLFSTLSQIFSTDMYDDAWNLRNAMVPYVPGDEHYDHELGDAPNAA